MTPFKYSFGGYWVIEAWITTNRTSSSYLKKKRNSSSRKSMKKNQTLIITLFNGKIVMLIVATIKDKYSTIYGLYLHQIEVYSMITSSIEKRKFISSNGQVDFGSRLKIHTNFSAEFHTDSVQKCEVILPSN